MKDTDLRALVLQGFYDCRRQRTKVGVGIDGILKFQIPGVSEQEILRICTELEESGLIDWKTVNDPWGNPSLGFGEINASGVDVFEGTVTPPLPIHIEPGKHQAISIPEQESGVKAATPNGQSQQEISRGLSILIEEINKTSGPEADKEEARLLLGKFLENNLARGVVGHRTTALAMACGI